MPYPRRLHFIFEHSNKAKPVQSRIAQLRVRDPGQQRLQSAINCNRFGGGLLLPASFRPPLCIVGDECRVHLKMRVRRRRSDVGGCKSETAASCRCPMSMQMFASCAAITSFMAPNGGGSNATSSTTPTISRLALIERLMKEPPNNYLEDEDGTEVVPVEEGSQIPRKRFWSTIDDFYRDNIAEVEAKLPNIEPQIWGKLIIMERNYRTAKAYLRHSNITVDGSSEEFDGIRLGLAQFHNEHRDSRTELELRFLGSGVRIKIDANGNLWMRRLTSRRICVKTRQKREQTILGDDFRKIFDLRIFKENVVAHMAADGDKQRLQEAALVFIRLSDLSPDTDVLRCPLWCGLIHLIAVDMIEVIGAEFHGSGVRNVAVSPPTSVGSGDHADGLGYSTSAEESSASSSSYLPSGSSYTRQNKSAVARRIFQQKKLPPPPPHVEHYSAPFTPFTPAEVPVARPRSRSKKPQKIRSKSHSHLIPQPPNPPPPIKSQLEIASALNGWSLLNLSDIDKLRTPTYFTSTEEAAARRDRRRASAQHQHHQNPRQHTPASPQDTRTSSKSRSGGRRTPQGASSPEAAPIGLTKYKWLSETALVSESGRRRR
uniref:MH2 domain-containing protein n=1 Tax=Panagrellus redivivus TaxID=6233 RepID=A0A7E4UQD8_PANRE